jgi:hypothetical protein
LLLQILTATVPHRPRFSAGIHFSQLPYLVSVCLLFLYTHNKKWVASPRRDHLLGSGLEKQSCPVTCQAGTEGTLNPSLKGVGGKRHVLAALGPGRTHSTHCTGGWVDLTGPGYHVFHNQFFAFHVTIGVHFSVT